MVYKIDGALGGGGGGGGGGTLHSPVVGVCCV